MQNVTFAKCIIGCDLWSLTYEPVIQSEGHLKANVNYGAPWQSKISANLKISNDPELNLQLSLLSNIEITTK